MTNTTPLSPGSARARHQESVDRTYRIGGVALALTGLSHFVAPVLFRAPTGLIFPADPARAVRINGASETLIGAAIAAPSTRTVGLAALGAYGAFLAGNALKALHRARTESK